MQYACIVSPAVDSITWSLRCLDQHNGAATTYSVQGDEHNTHYCQNSNGGRVSFAMSMTFLSSVATQSNLTITVLDANYSVSSLKSLSIDCEGSREYKHLDITG